jgi:hypothetical protein
MFRLMNGGGPIGSPGSQNPDDFGCAAVVIALSVLGLLVLVVLASRVL